MEIHKSWDDHIMDIEETLEAVRQSNAELYESSSNKITQLFQLYYLDLFQFIYQVRLLDQSEKDKLLSSSSTAQKPPLKLLKYILEYR